jgi:diguanylate cyclase (GGDEF)-like protein
MDSDDLQRQLQQIWQEYADSLPDRLKQIADEIARLHTSANSEKDLVGLFRLVHSLAGSASSFGYSTLGQQAQRLEQAIKMQIDKNAVPNESVWIEFEKAFDKLQHLANQSPENAHTEVVSADPVARVATDDGYRRHIYLVEDDPVLGQEMASQLAYFGLDVKVFPDATLADAAIQKKMPDLLVVDLGLPEGMLAGSRLDTTAQGEGRPPIIFISARGDWEARLAAVRGGGSVYLTKPVDVPILLDHIDRLLHKHKPEPYRILIVDDDQVLSAHYALVLHKAGMRVEVLNQPERILNALVSFKPELILMDLYMPNVSGIEVAKVIRQDQKLFSMPIVFLSSEQDLDTQLVALHQGDDFRQKPISDQHLVAVVEIRAERMRSLGTLMYHDGLTGALNHISLKQHLETELARARRKDTPVCFILLDIDHFKSVNDRFGHSAGDKVIKILSRLLIDRFRQSDQVGRYGGEEFGIILPDTEYDAATTIIDKIREDFAEIVHRLENTEFHCSFSAGVAQTCGRSDVKTLINAADAALYRAKYEGRNRIVKFWESL